MGVSIITFKRCSVFPEFRFFPEIRKSGSFRFFGRFFIRPRPLVRFPDFKKMLANSRVFHPRKLQTALCKPRENRLCPLRLPNLTISAALISTDHSLCNMTWKPTVHAWCVILGLGWGHDLTLVEAIIPPLCSLWDRWYIGRSTLTIKIYAEVYRIS